MLLKKRHRSATLTFGAGKKALVDPVMPTWIPCQGRAVQCTLDGGVGWGVCHSGGATLAPSYLGSACPDLPPGPPCNAVRDSGHPTGRFCAQVQGSISIMHDTYSTEYTTVSRLSPRVGAISMPVTKKRPNSHKAATIKNVFLGYIPSDQCFASDFSDGTYVNQVRCESGCWVGISLETWCAPLYRADRGIAARAFLSQVPILNTELLMIDRQIVRQGLAVPFRVLVVYMVAWIEDPTLSPPVDECIENLVRNVVSELISCSSAELAAISEAWTMGELQEEYAFVNSDSHLDEDEIFDMLVSSTGRRVLDVYRLSMGMMRSRSPMWGRDEILAALERRFPPSMCKDRTVFNRVDASQQPVGDRVPLEHPTRDLAPGGGVALASDERENGHKGSRKSRKSRKRELTDGYDGGKLERRIRQRGFDPSVKNAAKDDRPVESTRRDDPGDNRGACTEPDGECTGDSSHVKGGTRTKQTESRGTATRQIVRPPSDVSKHSGGYERAPDVDRGGTRKEARHPPLGACTTKCIFFHFDELYMQRVVATASNPTTRRG